MDKYLSTFFDNITDFTPAEKAIIADCFTEKTYPAKHQLVEFEAKTDTLYLLKKGCIRKYCYKDGLPWTLLIATENQFVLEYVSFMSGERSNNILETVEDCTVLEIKRTDLEHLYQAVPKMNEAMRKALQNAIYQVHMLLNDFIMLSPEERYTRLVATNPALMQRVPQHILASYLGVSATSLSRIRKRITEKN